MVGPRGTTEAVHEVARSDARQAELEGVHHDKLHGDDLASSIRVVGDVRELFRSRSVDLFVLAREHDARAAEKLQPSARDFERGQAPIDEIDHLLKFVCTAIRALS